MADDVLVINHHQASLTVKADAVRGTSKARMTTTVTSEPLVFMLEEGAVAKRAAEMFAQRIREQTLAIAEPVKAATARARRTAERAFARGEAWAVQRYSGGRTGVTPPRPGENRAFNHSGRLALGITANYSKQSKEWFIRTAANRWKASDFRSPAAMAHAFREWVARIPVLQDASSDLGIQRAIRTTVEKDVMHKSPMGTPAATAKAQAQARVQTGTADASLEDLLRASIERNAGGAA